MSCRLSLRASRYLNQCWLIINWAPGNRFQWHLNQSTIIFIQENVRKWWPFCIGLNVDVFQVKSRWYVTAPLVIDPVNMRRRYISWQNKVIQRTVGIARSSFHKWLQGMPHSLPVRPRCVVSLCNFKAGTAFCLCRRYDVSINVLYRAAIYRVYSSTITFRRYFIPPASTKLKGG